MDAETVVRGIQCGWLTKFEAPRFFKLLLGNNKTRTISECFNRELAIGNKQDFACGNDSYAEAMMHYFNLSIQDKPWKARSLALDAVHNATRGQHMNQSPAACMFLKEAALLQQAKDQFAWKEPDVVGERLSHRWTKQVIDLQDELNRMKKITSRTLDLKKKQTNSETTRTDIMKPAVVVNARTWRLEKVSKDDL